MSDTNFQKSQAYLTWAEWGPAAKIPRDERLAESYPEVPADERAAWLKEFDQIESFVWRLAEDGKAQSLSQDEFAALIRVDFPFMDDFAISKAHFLAAYYQWHG